ncbi:Fc.00g001260.m01.CDS01 [Cosmosporella sp. VM-42]
MVTELGANGQSSIDLLDAWRHHGALSCRDELGSLDLTSKDIAEVPRYAASDALLETLLKDGPYAAMQHGSDFSHQPRKASGSRATTPLTLPVSPQFSFTLPATASKPLEIRSRPVPAVWYGVKRRRYVCDVDGFNTAGLCSKKRRLRAELITSRLSQPYSQPATHILNREGQDSGDKRFLKMATSVDTARRIAHLHATSFLRFSIMNRLRRRLGLGLQPALRPKAHDEETAVVAASPTLKAPWKPQSLQASAAGKSVRPSPLPGGGTGTSPVTTPSERSDQAVNNPKATHPHAKTHACRLSKPAALPLPAGDAVATKNRTSPRIHPVQSPELRPSSMPLDDLDEDCFGYLHPEDDDWDDGADDPDNVYSDFSVIFGEGSPGAEAQEERTYEEYLDELDGICWVTR